MTFDEILEEVKTTHAEHIEMYNDPNPYIIGVILVKLERALNENEFLKKRVKHLEEVTFGTYIA